MRGPGVRALGLGLLVACTSALGDELPTYPGTRLARIGNDLAIDGELYRIGYFVTDDSVNDVAEFFHHQWHREGIPCTVDGDMRTGGVVSAFYTRDGIQRAVVLRAHGKKTVGFSVIHDLWVTAKAPVRPARLKLEGTLFAGDVATRVDAASHAPDDASQSLLVERGLQATRRDVLAQLEHAGFKLTRESASQVDGVEHRVLEHAHGTERILTTLAEVDAGLTAVLTTSLSSGRPR